MDQNSVLFELRQELSDLINRAEGLIDIYDNGHGDRGKYNYSFSSIKHDLILILNQLGPAAKYILEQVEELPNSVNSAEGEYVGELCGYVSSTNTTLQKLLKGQFSYINDHFKSNKFSSKIFIVHGHDNEMLQSVSNYIRSINLTPVVLHEQPNKGRTIIEKFVDYSDVGFSIVLLSPDDKAIENEKAIGRARQNVIFELGYFIGKLGRERVVALYKNSVQIPSDYSGVLYVEYNRSDTWKIQIAKELKAVDFNIDFNLIF